jgi:hypothetical protein
MKAATVNEVLADVFLQRIATHGGHFLVGEYRGSAVSVIEYLDKESGKKESYVKVVHSIEAGCEAGMETVHVQEMIDRAVVNPDQYKATCWLERGMRIVVVPRRVEIDKGIKKFTCATTDMLLLRNGGHPEKGEKK